MMLPIFFMPIRWGSVIKRKHSIRDFLNIITLYIRNTFRTQDYAIGAILAPALGYGNTGNSFPFLLPKVFPAFGTPESPAINFALPILGITNSSPMEIHNNLSPIMEWRNIDGEWWHYIDGKWSGIIISRVTHIQVFRAKQPVKTLKLPCQYYQITHRIINKEYDIDTTIIVASLPTYSKALKFARLYSDEWRAANQ